MCADFNRQTEQFLTVNVPRMHTETRPGEAAPAEPESIVGAQVDFERIADSGTSGGDRIYQYVQEPLRKWLANFDSVVVRLQHQNSNGNLVKLITSLSVYDYQSISFLFMQGIVMVTSRSSLLVHVS
jgi:hypothetical protein